MQLQRLAEQVGAEFFPPPAGAAPVAIANRAVDHARRHQHDVVIVDTAGRLHVDAELMEEVQAIERAVGATERLFVIDGMAGQDAVTRRALRRGARSHRRHPHQGRRRCARRRGAVGARGHRQAHRVRRRRREDRRARALRCRAHGARILGMGDVRRAGRAGAEEGRRREGREARQEGRQGQGLRPRTSRAAREFSRWAASRRSMDKLPTQACRQGALAQVDDKMSAGRSPSSIP